MTETTIAIDRPPDAGSKPSSHRARPAGPAAVSASALALHLDCSRTYIQKLEAEGVLHRDGGGFDVDASRIAYLRYLRRERQQSPRSEADADFAKAKSELIRLRIQEKRRDLIPLSEAIETTDQIVGIMLTAMGSMPARIAGHDLAARRKIEKIIFEVRTEIANAASKLADERGEPREDDAA